jgi:hypothetical protein
VRSQLLAFIIPDRACGGFDFAFDLAQAGIEVVGGFLDRQQVASFGIKQEQQTIEERQDALENGVETFLGKLGIASFLMANMRDETLGEDLENILEYPILQILAELRSELAAAFLISRRWRSVLSI